MQIRELLANCQINRLDNRLLLSYVTGFNKVQLITHDNYILTNQQLISYNQLVDRVLDGEPLAYIIGYKEFYNHTFIVSKDTLIPRPETELIVDLILKLAKPHDKILDMGTGTGCIAISCKLARQDLTITALDNYPLTLKIARQNADDLQADIKLIESNWFEKVENKYDIIVSNPPYIDQNDEHLLNLKYEPLHALTDFANGLTAITHIIQNSNNYLKHNGYLIFEHGYNQAEKIQQILYNYGFSNINTIRDYANLPRITYAQSNSME